MKGDHFTCCLCKNPILKNFKKLTTLLVVCQDCKTIIKENDGIFCNNKKSNVDFDKFNLFYDSMYYHSDMDLDKLFEIKKKPILLTYAIRKLLIAFYRKINPKVIMDMGGGRGENIVSISNDDSKATVIVNDISKNALLISKKFLEKSKKLGDSLLIQGPLEEVNFKKNSVDLIICTEVLEHLLDDNAVIQKMNTFLKPGGHAFITTPCNKKYDMTEEYVNLNQDGTFDYNKVLDGGSHGSAAGGDLRRYSYTQLINKFKSNNFEIISERWCGSGIFGKLAYRLNNNILLIGKKLSEIEHSEKDIYNVRNVTKRDSIGLDKSSKFYLSYVRPLVNFIYGLDLIFRIEGQGHLICILKKV